MNLLGAADSLNDIGLLRVFRRTVIQIIFLAEWIEIEKFIMSGRNEECFLRIAKGIVARSEVTITGDYICDLILSTSSLAYFSQ